MLVILILMVIAVGGDQPTWWQNLDSDPRRSSCDDVCGAESLVCSDAAAWPFTLEALQVVLRSIKNPIPGVEINCFMSSPLRIEYAPFILNHPEAGRNEYECSFPQVIHPTCNNATNQSQFVRICPCYCPSLNSTGCQCMPNAERNISDGPCKCNTGFLSSDGISCAPCPEDMVPNSDQSICICEKEGFGTTELSDFCQNCSAIGRIVSDHGFCECKPGLVPSPDQQTCICGEGFGTTEIADTCENCSATGKFSNGLQPCMNCSSSMVAPDGVTCQENETKSKIGIAIPYIIAIVIGAILFGLLSVVFWRRRKLETVTVVSSQVRSTGFL